MTQNADSGRDMAIGLLREVSRSPISFGGCRYRHDLGESRTYSAMRIDDDLLRRIRECLAHIGSSGLGQGSPSSGSVGRAD